MTQGLSPVSSTDSAVSSPGDGGRLSRVITKESLEEEGRLDGERAVRRGDEESEGGMMGGPLSKIASGGAVRGLLDEFCRLDGE